MAGALRPFAGAENEARARRLAAEIEEYKRVRLHLKEIVEKGRDEDIWTVRLNVYGLPERSGSLWGRISHSKYKSRNQSNEDYLRKVLDSFDLYLGEDMLQARSGGLSLYFSVRKEAQNQHSCHEAQ